MRDIKKGEPVIEYIGERMALSEFHRREEQQEQKQSLYCVELTRETEDQEMFCVGRFLYFANISISRRNSNGTYRY